jgi:2-isopropylmalate synthase
MPLEFGEKILMIKKKVKNIQKAIISVHCHNDLGLAVANSLSAVSSGARQVECTINGIGERAGNASLEEIVMSLNVRKDYWDYSTDIVTKEIYNTSKMVSKHTGMIVQANKAIVGDNAFAHESGIHQDGFLKNRETYEIMTPESVGLNKSKIILGRHSGRHGIQSRLSELGYDLSNKEMNRVYSKFLELADKKKEIFDDDLRILMGDRNVNKHNSFELDYLHVNNGTNTIPTATVRIKTPDSIEQESATGDGPVAACFKAIKRALKLDYDIKLHDYKVRSITSGKDAFGEVIIRLFIKESLYISKGTSTDTIKASVKAYLDALNQYENDKKNRYLLFIEESVNV